MRKKEDFCRLALGTCQSLFHLAIVLPVLLLFLPQDLIGSQVPEVANKMAEHSEFLLRSDLQFFHMMVVE